MIKAVVFDWAGTVIDYGCRAPAAVFIEIFRRKGIELSFEQARGPMGMAKIDHVRELLKLEKVQEQWQDRYLSLPGEKEVEALYLQLEPEMASVVTRYSKLIPGVADLTMELQSREVKIGSTTGYVRSMMEHLIPEAEAQGFRPDAIVCSSDVPSGRPAPWGVYLNMQLMNVYPLSQTVKVGDTLADIREGCNADMWVVGCTRSGNELGLSEEESRKMDPALLKEKLRKAESKFLDAGAHYVVEGTWELLPVLEEIGERIRSGEKPPSRPL